MEALAVMGTRDCPWAAAVPHLDVCREQCEKAVDLLLALLQNPDAGFGPA